MPKACWEQEQRAGGILRGSILGLLPGYRERPRCGMASHFGSLTYSSCYMYFFKKISGFLRSIFPGYYMLDFSGLDRETTTYLSLSFYPKTPQKPKSMKLKQPINSKITLLKFFCLPWTRVNSASPTKNCISKLF